jgi:hypothetical protein
MTAIIGGESGNKLGPGAWGAALTGLKETVAGAARARRPGVAPPSATS